MQSEPVDDAPQPPIVEALDVELHAPLLHSARFKVKRWAGKDHRRPTSVSSPTSNFVPPTPKSPPLPGPPRLDRWSHGFVAHNYRPHLAPLTLGSDYGAPPVFHQQRSFEMHPVGGLVLAPRGLGIHRPGMSHLALQPCRPPAPPMISQHFALSSNSVGDSSAPVSGIRPSNGPVQKMCELHDQLKAQHFQSWLALLTDAGSSSSLFRDTAESPLVDEHRIKAIAHYAPSTMASYLRMWAQWYEFATCHQASPYCPSVVLVADFLHVHSSSSTQGLAVNHLKAMMWVAKHAGLPELLVTLQLPLSKAYGLASSPQPRREAPPLPLSFVVWLEKSVLASTSSMADRLVMGALLLMVWASLRWSDAQWVSPADLVEDAESLRGMARRTKTTTRGMPFGALRSGLLGVNNPSPWCAVWVNILRETLQRTALRCQGFVPDFLIPQIGKDVDRPLYLSPMPRSQGILLLRRYLLMSDPTADVSHIGVHSCKVTFLSWSRQLGLNEELRRHQGHHRAPAGSACVDLYSRDDVHPALELQRIVRAKLATGFRPVVPVARGVGLAVKDLPVSLPALPEAMAVDAQTSIQLDSAELHVDTDSNASEGEDLPDTCDSSVPQVPHLSHDISDCVFLLNDISLVAHIASDCDPSDPQRICTFDWHGTIRSFKFACSARRSVGDMSITPSESIPPSYRICLRAACSRVFD